MQNYQWVFFAIPIFEQEKEYVLNCVYYTSLATFVLFVTSLHEQILAHKLKMLSALVKSSSFFRQNKSSVSSFYSSQNWQKFLQKNLIKTFDYIINQKKTYFPMEKTDHFFSSKTEHTDNLVRLNTEHTDNLLRLNTEHTDNLLR